MAWTRQKYRAFRAGHPAWRRCSSLKYTRYSRSSRLASRAPRAGIHGTSVVSTPLVGPGELLQHGGQVCVEIGRDSSEVEQYTIRLDASDDRWV